MDDDPLLGLGLHPVQLTDQATFNAYFRLLNDPLSDYTFSQLFTWGNSLRILWKELHGHLCVFANGTGDLTLLMPPIGQGDSARALAEAFQVMDAYNDAHDAHGHSRVEYVSEELLARLDRSRLLIEPMGADYVYDVARMIDLAGGDLASKRQLKNRFLRNYRYRVEPYDAVRHRDGCRQLLRLWKYQADTQHAAEHSTSALKRQKETLACELTLEHAHSLGIKGLVVYTQPVAPGDPPPLSTPHPAADTWSLSAFTFGEPLGAAQSSILVEKTDLNVRGLAQFIFSEFCRLCWADRPLVNAGDDWGLETLAWTKMSYRPIRMMRKYMLHLAPRAAVVLPAAMPQPRDLALRQALPVDDVLIRSATPHDVPAALALEQKCFTAYQLTKRQLQYLQHRHSALFLVAEHDRHIVGQGICLLRQHKKGQSGRIYSLAVDSAHRRKKIGRKLLLAMLAGLAARGVSRVYLEVEQDNAAAIGLYQLNGFRSIGLLPDYYAPGRPALHMMCQLPAAATTTVPKALVGAR